MVKIKKLTPPQIEAIREAFPACIEARVIVTTNSIATFRDLVGREPWRPEHIRRLLVDMTNRYDDLPVYDRLDTVLTKLNTRPDLVEVA